MAKIDRETLVALRERLAAATGADRRLDDSLHDAFKQQGALAPHYTGSVDDALCFAEQVAPKEWPFILDRARSELARRHSWHMCFARPEQREELPREICIYTVATLLVSEVYNAR